MSMITIISPTGQTIHTDSCEVLQQILEEDGISWIKALKGPVTVSATAFDEIDNLISISL